MLEHKLWKLFCRNLEPGHRVASSSVRDIEKKWVEPGTRLAMHHRRLSVLDLLSVH